MCDFTEQTPFIAELRARHADSSRTEQRMSNAIVFDRKPLAVFMVQRVTRSRPPVTITAPAPEAQCTPYDIVSEANRDAYLRQSAATTGGKVAEFQRL